MTFKTFYFLYFLYPTTPAAITDATTTEEIRIIMLRFEFSPLKPSDDVVALPGHFVDAVIYLARTVSIETCGLFVLVFTSLCKLTSAVVSESRDLKIALFFPSFTFSSNHANNAPYTPRMVLPVSMTLKSRAFLAFYYMYPHMHASPRAWRPRPTGRTSGRHSCRRA